MRAQMRICITTHYWAPHVGGTERVAFEQARRLVDRGHEVIVVTSRLDGDASRESHDGVHVRRVAAWNGPEARGIPYPLFGPSLLRALSQEIARSDVVLVHGHAFIPSMAAARVARHHKRPVVLLQHNPDLHHPFPANVAGRVIDAMGASLTIAASDRCLAVSRHTAAHIRRLGGARDVELLSNGVDANRFRSCGSPEHRARVRDQLGWKNDEVVFLTVRRLVPRMGVEILVDATAGLPADPAVRTVVVGDGPLRPNLMRRTTGPHRIDFPGRIGDPDLARHYAAADVFVLPTSSGEGFGLVVLEAFASGLPVIATRSGAPTEIVDHGRNGLLVPPDDPGALSAAMSYLAADRERLRTMGYTAARSLDGLSWDDNVDRLEAVLAAVVEPVR